MKKHLALFLIVTFVTTGFSGCFWDKKPDAGDTTAPIDDRTGVLPKAEAGLFATYAEDSISYTPAVPAYETGENFENVLIPPSINLSDGQKAYLEKNLFVTTDGYSREFFEPYESNRYALTPNFITTDSVLHTYHLYFDYLLRALEEQELFDTAIRLSESMVAASLAQYDKVKGTDFESAAKRNVAYYAAGLNLLDSTKEIPSMVLDMVNSELGLINAHNGIVSSNLFGDSSDPYFEDYSQYIPRGHYTKSEKLQKYFRGMMWYGRMNFRLKSADETKSALLTVAALESDPALLQKWDTIFEPINFFVGEPDDLVYYDYLTAAKAIYGAGLTTDKLTSDSAKFTKFQEAAKTLRNPSINSMVLFDPELIPNDRNDETKGFRFLGQRSTIDATIFQQLVYRSVDKNPEGSKRMLPKGLDIAAAMGSKEAYDLLVEMKDTEYAKYTENMDKMKQLLANLTAQDWSKNLYFGWISTIKTLTKEYGVGYPDFMLNKAWKLKELMTYLGSWTELKHDTILYAKQVYAELGGGPMEETFDDRGYVEPNPELYNKLKSLIQYTIDGLSSRDILSEANKTELGKLKDLVTQLRDISIKELQNETLTDAEYELIRTYGGSLEHFWTDTLSAAEKEMDRQAVLNGSPAAVVADVATDPNGTVLEEGTGWVYPIYVVVPVDGQLKVAKGAMFSQYEFPWPLNDRLTDEKWRDMLENNKQPNLSSWAEFIVPYTR